MSCVGVHEGASDGSGGEDVRILFVAMLVVVTLVVVVLGVVLNVVGAKIEAGVGAAANAGLMGVVLNPENALFMIGWVS